MDEPRFSPNEAPLDGLPPLPPSPTLPDVVLPSSIFGQAQEAPTSSSYSPQPEQYSLDPLRHTSPPESRGTQPVEHLAHRLSKQTLRTVATPLPSSQPHDLHMHSSSWSELPDPLPVAKLPPSLRSRGSMPMQIDYKDHPSITERLVHEPSQEAQSSGRSLKRSADEMSGDDQWWDTSAIRRKLQQAPWATRMPVIDFDTSNLEVDQDELTPLQETGSGDRQTLTTYRIQFRTSLQAARQCSKLVRSRPRQRKRGKNPHSEGTRSRSSTVGSSADHHRTTIGPRGPI